MMEELEKEMVEEEERQEEEVASPSPLRLPSSSRRKSRSNVARKLIMEEGSSDDQKEEPKGQDEGLPKIPKEETIDFSELNFPKFFFPKEDLTERSSRPSRKRKMSSVIGKVKGNLNKFDVVGPINVKAPSKEVNIAPVPKVAKKPNAADVIYETEIPEPSELKLYLDEVESVRGFDARGR